MLCTGSLLSLPEKGDHLVNTAKQYKDGSIAVENPREEATEIFTMVRDTIVNSRAKAWTMHQQSCQRLYIFQMTNDRTTYVPACIYEECHCLID